MAKSTKRTKSTEMIKKQSRKFELETADMLLNSAGFLYFFNDPDLIEVYREINVVGRKFRVIIKEVDVDGEEKIET